MIPKVIHYCWVGGNPLTPLAEKCINSWKKYCPDYEIIRWDESNYDFTKNGYMEQAYQAKKWGFVPDYARLDIIYQYGGIYLDTDVEIIKSLDPLLSNECFCGIELCEEENIVVALGLGFGATPNNPILKEMMLQYDGMSFINKDGSLNLVASPIYQTEILLKKGLTCTNRIQKVSGVTVYPKEYFNPIDLSTGKVSIQEATFSIHHYAASWLDKKSKIRYEIHKFLNRAIGKKNTDIIRNILGIK